MSFYRSLARAGLMLLLAGCVAVPTYQPPVGYPSAAYEYYPNYNYYYGGAYPFYYSGVGVYDWGYWGHEGGDWHDGGHWGGGHGRYRR